jgi:hypothetical protein
MVRSVASFFSSVAIYKLFFIAWSGTVVLSNDLPAKIYEYFIHVRYVHQLSVSKVHLVGIYLDGVLKSHSTEHFPSFVTPRRLSIESQPYALRGPICSLQ